MSMFRSYSGYYTSLRSSCSQGTLSSWPFQNSSCFFLKKKKKKRNKIYISQNGQSTSLFYLISFYFFFSAIQTAASYHRNAKSASQSEWLIYTDCVTIIKSLGIRTKAFTSFCCKSSIYSCREILCSVAVCLHNRKMFSLYYLG